MKESNKMEEVHLERVSVECEAISDGHMNGRVVRAGSHFRFNGNLKNGNFPLWCNPLKEFESAYERDEASEKVAVPAKKVAKKVAKKASKKVAKKVAKKVIKKVETKKVVDTASLV